MVSYWCPKPMWQSLFYNQGYRNWIYALKIISDKLSSVGQFGLRNMRNLYYFPIFGQLVMQLFWQCCVQHANVSTTFGQCFVKLPNVWTAMCSTIQWLGYAVSNCLAACELSVQLSNGWTVIFPTVQWLDSYVSNLPNSDNSVSKCPMFLDSAVSNSPMVSECWVKLSNGWPSDCLSVKWSDWALSNCPMVGQCCSKQSNC